MTYPTLENDFHTRPRSAGSRPLLFASLAFVVLALVACGAGSDAGGDEEPAADTMHEDAMHEAAESDEMHSGDETPEVEYEPAYPDEVSDEELDETDLHHQHEAGEDHPHGENGHAHDEDGSLGDGGHHG